jgi:predicted GTPase
MSKAFERIAKEASQLSREQRLDLASRLLEFNDDSPVTDVTAEWETEILARIRAIDENDAEGISFEAVMREAEELLTSGLLD